MCVKGAGHAYKFKAASMKVNISSILLINLLYVLPMHGEPS